MFYIYKNICYKIAGKVRRKTWNV